MTGGAIRPTTASQNAVTKAAPPAPSAPPPPQTAIAPEPPTGTPLQPAASAGTIIPPGSGAPDKRTALRGAVPNFNFSGKVDFYAHNTDAGAAQFVGLQDDKDHVLFAQDRADGQLEFVLRHKAGAEFDASRDQTLTLDATARVQLAQIIRAIAVSERNQSREAAPHRFGYDRGSAAHTRSTYVQEAASRTDHRYHLLTAFADRVAPAQP